MNSAPYDIVLRPSFSLAELAYNTSQELINKGTFFTLKNGEYFPHVSLYMVELATDSIDQVKNSLEKLANEISEVQLTAKELHQEGGYIDIEYERNETIDDIQNQVLKAINPLRNGLRKKDQERIKTATGIELENLHEYGYRSVGIEFAPHLTLTRFINEHTKASIVADLHEFDGTFTSLAVFEMGENGTCVKLLFETPLG